VDFRARLRRAFPYLVIGIGGFALAYVIIFVFVLPSKIVPPAKQPYIPDSSGTLQPIDTSVVHLPADTGFQQATVPMGMPTEAPPDLGPTDVPDLVGMALADARAVLNSYRLQASVRRDTSSFQPPNTVLSQSPESGARIASGGTVSLTVSYFPAETPAESVPPALPSTLPPARAPLPGTHPGSTVTDSGRTVPRRPLPRIIPMDSVPPNPLPNPARTPAPIRPDSTTTPASAQLPG
jgi:hypothetical protein